MKKIGIAVISAFLLMVSACSSDDKVQMDKFDGTPHIFIVEDGEMQASISPANMDDGHDSYFELSDKFDALMKDYDLLEKNEKSGEVKQINYETFLKMWKEDKQKFMVVVSQTGCGHCKSFKENVLDDYVKEHGIHVYELNITNEKAPRDTYTALQELVEQ